MKTLRVAGFSADEVSTSVSEERLGLPEAESRAPPVPAEFSQPWPGRPIAEARSDDRWLLIVADEHVIGRVRVVHDEVRGSTFESDKAAIGGDRGVVAVVVPLLPTRGDTLAHGRPSQSVAQEDI